MVSCYILYYSITSYLFHSRYLPDKMTQCFQFFLKSSFLEHRITKTYLCRSFSKAVVEESVSEDDDFKSNVAPRDVRRLYVWGYGETGALGYTSQDGNKKRKQMIHDYFKVPIRLHFGHHHKISDIACGYGFTLVSTQNKDNNLKLFGCGLNTDSQVGYHDIRKAGKPLSLILSLVRIQIPFKYEDTKIEKIAAGRAHSILITTEGVFTFGNNSFGQCGRQIVENEEYSKKWNCHKFSNLGGEKVVDAVCGQDHTLFLTESGKVYSCGWSADGQTGLGHYNNQGKPCLVKGDIEGEKIVKLSCSVDCVLALNDKGEVFGWGNSEYSQLSQKDLQISLPIHLKKCSGFSRVIDVAAGGSACLLLNDEGSVFSWGFGILGRGPEVSKSPNPTLIPDTLFGRSVLNEKCRVTSIVAGPSTFAALTNSALLYMWGKNQFGQLGIGSLKDQFFPLKVAVGADISKVALGVDHSVALSKHFVR